MAYRLSSKTVIRTGGGIFFIPSTVQFPEGPYGNVVNYLNHVMVGTTNNNATPQNTLSDPYPGGFLAPPGRDPIFQKVLLGGNNRAPLRFGDYGYTEQWNFSVQHQLTPGLALEGSYAGLHGVHLPQGGFQLDALPQEYLSMGAALTTQVDNPLYGLIQNGPFSQPKVQQGLLLMPFPAVHVAAGSRRVSGKQHLPFAAGQSREAVFRRRLAAGCVYVLQGDLRCGDPDYLARLRQWRFGCPELERLPIGARSLQLRLAAAADHQLCRGPAGRQRQAAGFPACMDLATGWYRVGGSTA